MIHEPGLINEIFVGNVAVDKDHSDFIRLGIKFRIGDQAFDIYGEKIEKSYMLPLFVHKESFEAYNKFMEERK